jgi:predicted Ser/Thr protein kinase
MSTKPADTSATDDDDSLRSAGVDAPSADGVQPPQTLPFVGASLVVTIDQASRVNADLSPTSLPQASSRLGRYELVRELGRGGMSAVYLAYDSQLERQVALKVPLGTALANEGRSRFFREARAAAKLRHPNICPVYDVAEVDGVTFFTMAFIEGESLAARARRTALSAGEATSIVRTLALAMQDAHEQGVIHRDLKPANVLLDASGRPIITDFGLARSAVDDTAHLTQDGQLLGTPAYMPPEQMRGDVQAMGPWSDQYSLGMILYELLAGRLPFTGSLATLIAACLNDAPPPPSQFRPNMPPGLDAICLRVLAKNPAQRFGSMAEFATALAPFADQRPAAFLQPPLAEDTATAAATVRAGLSMPASAPTRSRRGWAVAAGCVVTLGVVLAMATGLAYLAFSSVMQVGRALSTDFGYAPNWTDAARLWRAPPVDQLPLDFAKLTLPSATLVRQDELAAIEDLNVDMPGQHAVYRARDGGEVDIFLYQASPLEREAIFRRVLAAVDRPEKMPDGSFENEEKSAYPNYPYRHLEGSAEGSYIDYQHRWTTLTPGDSAVFWHDEGWLFVARSRTDADPRRILSDLLEATNGGVRTSAVK